MSLPLFHSFEREHFLQAVFEKTAAKQKSTDDLLAALLTEEWVELCNEFDAAPVQNSWSWRNVHIARCLAQILIDPKGHLDQHAVRKAIEILKKNFFSLGPKRHLDVSLQTHLLQCLQKLHEDKELEIILNRITRPFGHPGAEKILRETLILSEGVVLTDAHAKQAVLSAFLTLLRQNVGSCFATAPAILIQQQQPKQFLHDLEQLISASKLVRTFGGVEHAVPMSPGWGAGDLLRPFFLAPLGDAPLQILARLPGLQAAFQAAGLIDSRADKAEKTTVCMRLLEESGIDMEDPFYPFTMDHILKTVFLRAYHLTEEDIKRYHERGEEIPLQHLSIHPSAQKKGKHLDAARYLKNLNSAKKAFKALTDNALLKSWEFTLASLAEAKADFAKWNFFISLGVQPEEKNGIGKSLHDNISAQVEKINQEMEEYQSRYEHLFAHVKALEGRFQRVSSEKDAEWLRAEYQMRRHEIHRILSERDEIYEKGQKLSRLFPFLITFYGEKIRDYFQEVYDAEMHDVSSNPYDDSPAGFRLLYKHGRANPSLWTMIYTQEEYIQYLSAFFVSVEIELSHQQEVEGLQKELGELTTAILLAIKRPEFLESSLERLAIAYREKLVHSPLEHLSYVKRKPWAYVSGGTMGTLVSCYYGRVELPREEKRWVESENELLAFMIDALKGLPHATQKMYREHPDRPMLAFSPTHAFSIKPGWHLLRNGWEDRGYTYTWIRDEWMNPQLFFLDRHLLDLGMIEYLVDQFLSAIPIGYRPIVRSVLRAIPFPMHPFEFREYILKRLGYERWLQEGSRLDQLAEELDSLLYRTLPLFPETLLRENVEKILNVIQIVDSKLKEAIQPILKAVENQQGRHRTLSASDLRNCVMGVLMLAIKKTRTEKSYFNEVIKAMRDLGFMYPEPILFADTNWVNNVFGFVVNPGTGKVELWRFDDHGVEGRPIFAWKRYVNGADPKDWGVYNHPHEYGL